MLSGLCKSDITSTIMALSTLLITLLLVKNLNSSQNRCEMWVLDYQLPSMNGIELYDHLHPTRERAALLAIMLSAHLPIQELEKRKMVGLEKLIELSVLLEAVEQALADHDREP
jgi:CheY-like chemotaxis protein